MRLMVIVMVTCHDIDGKCSSSVVVYNLMPTRWTCTDVCPISTSATDHIGGRSRGARGPWPLLNFKTLHSNSIFAIENHLS